MGIFDFLRSKKERSNARAWKEYQKNLSRGFSGIATEEEFDGNKYAGEWKDNKKHGQGTYTFADGGKYVGEWKDGKKSGYGTWTRFGGKYVGEWKDDREHGQGTLTFADGIKYVGEWKDGKKSGYGTWTSSDGTVKKGLFKNDMFLGE
jgi:hypothetical protein